MIWNSIPSTKGWPGRQYFSLRLTTTFWLSAQLTKTQRPAPTGLRSNSAPACAAFGETIMPARSEKIAGNAVSGFFSFSVTCKGPVTSTEAMLATSDLMLERWSARLRSRLNFTASASNGAPSWKVTFG